MPLFAHALIEEPDSGVRYKRGDVVPDDLPGIEELQEAGSVKDVEYDPSQEPTQTPDELVIDGVVYKKSAPEGATLRDERA